RAERAGDRDDIVSPLLEHVDDMAADSPGRTCDRDLSGCHSAGDVAAVPSTGSRSWLGVGSSGAGRLAEGPVESFEPPTNPPPCTGSTSGGERPRVRAARPAAG